MKMDALFGAKISTVQSQSGVMPHIIIPRRDLPLHERDDLLSALPIQKGHLVIADSQLSFLIALLSHPQKRAIQTNPNIKFVGEVSIDIKTLTLLMKDGMRILSNPNIKKDGQ
ncbi:hypothetical protein ACXWTF_00205 [Thiomicrolovo sp. ZZH C-3]